MAREAPAKTPAAFGQQAGERVQFRGPPLARDMQDLELFDLGRARAALRTEDHGVSGEANREEDEAHPGHFAALQKVPKQPVADDRDKEVEEQIGDDRRNGEQLDAGHGRKLRHGKVRGLFDVQRLAPRGHFAKFSPERMIARGILEHFTLVVHGDGNGVAVAEFADRRQYRLGPESLDVRFERREPRHQALPFRGAKLGALGPEYGQRKVRFVAQHRLAHGDAQQRLDPCVAVFLGVFPDTHGHGPAAEHVLQQQVAMFRRNPGRVDIPQYDKIKGLEALGVIGQQAQLIGIKAFTMYTDFAAAAIQGRTDKREVFRFVIQDEAQDIVRADGLDIQACRDLSGRALAVIEDDLDAGGVLEEAMQAKTLIRLLRRIGGHAIDRALQIVHRVIHAHFDRAVNIARLVMHHHVDGRPRAVAISGAVIDEHIDGDIAFFGQGGARRQQSQQQKKSSSAQAQTHILLSQGAGPVSRAAAIPIRPSDCKPTTR